MLATRNLKSAGTQRRNSTSFRESTMAQVETDTETFARKLEGERRRLNNLNISFKQLQKEVNILKEEILSTNKSMNPVKNKLTFTKSLNIRKKTDYYLKKNDKLVGVVAQMRAEISQLRKDKRGLEQRIMSVHDQIERLELATADQYTQIETKNKLADQARTDVATLKEKLEREEKSFRKRFKGLKEQYELEVQQNLRSDTHYQTQAEYDHFDTATLLKRRLQTIIVNNKEKIKMIDAYQRNMRILDESFNTIKETSGLTNINQIEAIFVKSEQQNCALLTYLDMLNQEIDALADANAELQKRCEEQQKENKEREAVLNSTPEDEKKKLLLKKIAQDKLQLVNEVQDTMTNICPNIRVALQHLSKMPKDTVLTRFNYQKVLGELDWYVNRLLAAKSKKSASERVMRDALQISSIGPRADYHRVGAPAAIDQQMESSQVLYDYTKLQEIAKDVLKKVSQNTRKPKQARK